MQNLSKYAGLNYRRAGISVDMTVKQGLLYSNFTFTRSSGNAYFWDPVTPTIVGGFGVNVLRSGTISGKVGALLEGQRTNLNSNSEDFTGWTTYGGASVTGNFDTDPLGNLTADKLTFGADANSCIYAWQTGVPDNAACTVSIWAKTTSGTKGFRIGWTRKDSTDELSADLTATTTWQRFSFSIADVKSGGNLANKIVNSSDAAAGSIVIWGVQIEGEVKFPSSYIYTAGASAIRSPDLGYWASGLIPATMLSGKWKIKLIPFASSTEFAGTTSMFIMSMDGNNGIFLGTSDLRVKVYQGGVEKVDSNILSWDRYNILEFTFDSAGGKVTVSGALSGNGTVTGTSWSYSAADWYSGMRFDNTSHCNGILFEPEAA